jgi:hypothetical protein
VTELDLRETLERHVGGAAVPAADPLVAIGRGRRRRHRRRGLWAVCVTGALAAAVSGGVWAWPDDPPDRRSDAAQAVDRGQLDFSRGARAYADPGGELHLGGRALPSGGLGSLDTEAVATAYGLVYFDAGRPMLLGADGTPAALLDGEVDDPDGFHQSVKWDPARAEVAWTTVRGDTALLTVFDLATHEILRQGEAPCVGGCSVAIDAIDDGTVVVRKDDGTYLWGDQDPERIGGPDVRVADLRGGVLLWSGARPVVDGYRLVEGPIDASLTFDGRYVLDWSSRLRSTDGNPDLLLTQGSTERGARGFWALDSDGSVLVADPGPDTSGFTVYDCGVPLGECEELGPLRPTGGDPLFVGADM